MVRPLTALVPAVPHIVTEFVEADLQTSVRWWLLRRRPDDAVLTKSRGSADEEKV